MADPIPDPLLTVQVGSPRPADRPARRTFSDREKLRILEAADSCSQPVELGPLLRREGLYCSHLTSWRRWRRRRFPQHPQSQTPPTEADLRHERLASSTPASSTRGGSPAAPGPCTASSPNEAPRARARAGVDLGQHETPFASRARLPLRRDRPL